MFLHKINQVDESVYSWMKNVQMSRFQQLKKNRRASVKLIQRGFWKCFITSWVTDCSWPTEEPRHPSNEVKAWKSPEPPLQVFTWQRNRTQTHLSLHQLIYSFADLSMHSCIELLKIEQQPVAPAGYVSWGQHEMVTSLTRSSLLFLSGPKNDAGKLWQLQFNSGNI